MSTIRVVDNAASMRMRATRPLREHCSGVVGTATTYRETRPAVAMDSVVRPFQPGHVLGAVAGMAATQVGGHHAC